MRSRLNRKSLHRCCLFDSAGLVEWQRCAARHTQGGFRALDTRNAKASARKQYTPTVDAKQAQQAINTFQQKWEAVSDTRQEDQRKKQRIEVAKARLFYSNHLRCLQSSDASPSSSSSSSSSATPATPAAADTADNSAAAAAAAAKDREAKDVAIPADRGIRLWCVWLRTVIFSLFALLRFEQVGA